MRHKAFVGCALAVLMVVGALSIGSAKEPRGGRKRGQQQEVAVDMTVERHGHPGCDMIVTTNHFTLAAGESSNPITIDLSTCEGIEGPMEWLSFFGYLTTNTSSRTFNATSNMLMTGVNEDTGSTASSSGGRVMIGDVDWVIINGVKIQEAVPAFASFFVTNQNAQEVKVRLSSVVHFE